MAAPASLLLTALNLLPSMATTQLPAQYNELATNIATEVRYRHEVGAQALHQPHRFDVALGFIRRCASI